MPSQIQSFGAFLFIIVFSTEIACQTRTSSSIKLQYCSPDNSVFYADICIKCLTPFPSNDSTEMGSPRDVPDLNSLLGWKKASKNRRPGDSPPFICLSSTADQEKLLISIGIIYLNDRNVRVVTVERKPFVKFENGRFTGVCFEFFYAIQAKYNFSLTTSLPMDGGSFGAVTKNGSWSGMIGIVSRREADAGVAGFSVTLDRSRAIAFTDSFHQEPSGILIPPPAEGEKLSVIVRPLSFEVWRALCITMLILAPTLYMMHEISLRIQHRRDPKTVSQIVAELIQFMIGSLVQASVVSPVDKTSRFLIILWWLVTLIISNIYVAYLVSYLSAPKLFNAVDGLNDLVHQHHIKWTFRLNAAHQSLFKSNTSTGLYKSVGDGVSEAELVQSDYDGVKRVLTGKHAFIKEMSYLDVALADDFVQKHECRMTVAKESFFKVETALIVPKGSKILALLNYEIASTVATGLMAKWKSMHWPSAMNCNDAAKHISSTRPKTRKLQVNDLQGACLLLACGLSLAIMSFLVEKLVWKARKLYFRSSWSLQ